MGRPSVAYVEKFKIMKTLPCFAAALALSLSVPSHAAAPDAVPAPAEARPATFNVGGEAFFFPAPSDAYSEVGYDNREFMELWVPGSNRLISAYVLNGSMAELTSRSPDLRMDSYGMVQIARGLEMMQCSNSDFLEVMSETKKIMDDSLDEIVGDANNELKDRMKTISNVKVSVNQTVNLGTLFEGEDKYGFGIMCAVNAGDETIRMLIGCAILRVREKLLYVYFSERYKNEDTAVEVKNVLSAWSDKIIEANK